MRGAQFLLCFSFLCLFFVGSQGVTLNIYTLGNSASTDLKNTGACEVVCKETTSSPQSAVSTNRSGDTRHGSTATSNDAIQRMSLYTAVNNVKSLTAELSTTKNILSKKDVESSVEGLLTNHEGVIRLEVLNMVDCQAAFTCQVITEGGELKEVTNSLPNLEDNNVVKSSSGLEQEAGKTGENEVLNTFLLSLVEDMHAKIVSWETRFDGVDSKMSSVEQHLNTEVVNIKNDLIAQVTNIKNDLIAQVTNIKNDLTSQVTNIKNDLIAQVKNIKDDLANQITNTLNVLTTQTSSSEQRVTEHISTMKDDFAALETSSEQHVNTQIITMKDDLSKQVTAFKSDLSAQMTSVKADLISQLTSMKTDLTFQTTSFEQRLNAQMTAVKGDIESQVKSINDDITLKLDSSNNKLSIAESNLETEILQIEGRLISAMPGLGKSMPCSDFIVETLRDEVNKLQKDVINIVGVNVTDINNSFINAVDTLWGLVNVSNDVANKLDESIDTMVSSNRRHNYSCALELENITQTITSQIEDRSRWVVEKMVDIANISSINKLKSSLLEPEKCEKGMLPAPASPPYPYPLFYPYQGSAITKPYLCDSVTDSGGWYVIQKRSTGNTDFYRGWQDYKVGFGSLDDDFWLGLEYIHGLTSTGEFELRIDLKYQGKNYYAKYSKFSIANEANNYRLQVGAYSGTAGDELRINNGEEFTTKDKDNDGRDTTNCAAHYGGAWWYGISTRANLNGVWGEHNHHGLYWYTLTGVDSVTSTEMKIRRVS